MATPIVPSVTTQAEKSPASNRYNNLVVLLCPHLVAPSSNQATAARAVKHLSIMRTGKFP